MESVKHITMRSWRSERFDVTVLLDSEGYRAEGCVAATLNLTIASEVVHSYIVVSHWHESVYSKVSISNVCLVKHGAGCYFCKLGYVREFICILNSLRLMIWIFVNLSIYQN